MALIVEDGSQVAGANTFADDTDYTDYATLKGYTVGATAALREIELLTAMDYLLSRECTMQGYRASSTQSTLYPRKNVSLHGYSLESDTIPESLKTAQMEAAKASIDLSLLASETVQNIQSEQYIEGLVSLSYFKGGSITKVRLGTVDAYLKPLMLNTGKLVRT